MTAMDMLDAFIGLITVFLVLSLIVSAMVEILAIQLGKLHGNNLKAAITTLTDSQTQQLIYEHSRVRALSRPVKNPQDQPRGPSQMKDTTFVFCLLDTLVQGKYSYLRTRPIQLHDALLAAGLDRQTDGWKKEIYGRWQESAMDIAHFEASLCLWFGDCIDRSIGWFKRKLNVYLLGVGFIVACAVNADTLHIFQRLMADPHARQAHIEIAEDIAKRPEIIQSCVQQLNAETPDNNVQDIDNCEKKIKSLVIDLGPVVGWDSEDFRGKSALETVLFLLLKVPGFVLTAFATSLGAPFWFDLLKKLLGARRRLRGDNGSHSNRNDSNAALPPPGQGAPAKSENANAVTINQRLRRLPIPADRDVDFSDFSSFNASKMGYSPVNLVWAAKLSELSYKERDVCREVAKNWGLNADLLEHRATDTQCLVAESAEQGLVAFAFRGTEQKLQDMLTDAKFLQTEASWMPDSETEADDQQFRIHRGFAESIDAIWPQLSKRLESYVSQKYTIVFCGHSLGGALAVLASHRLLTEYSNTHSSPSPIINGLYTFGQPRVGNERFMEDVERKLYGLYIRSVNNRDVVAMVPPPHLPGEHKLSYVHAGQEIYFNDNGEAVLYASASYKTMDRLSVNHTASTEKLKELGSDHRMSDYLQLYGRYFSFSIEL